jgi:cytochrome c-type protein NapB
MGPRIVLLFAALSLTAAMCFAQGLTDAMRGRMPIADTTRPPLLGNAENKDVRRERAYAMQPPTIPHKVDNYQLDLNVNACLACHGRTRASQFQAVPVSVTHYMDRDGNFLAEVSPRRYFCEQCHVTQVDARPLVDNTYEDVEAVVRRAVERKRDAATAKK